MTTRLDRETILRRYRANAHCLTCCFVYVANREDPKGTSQPSLQYSEEPAKPTPSTLPAPSARRSSDRVPPLEPVRRGSSMSRQGAGSIREDTAPLLPAQAPQRQPRAGDVRGSGTLPAYQRPTDREYPVRTRSRSRTGDSGDIGHYVGYPPEHDQPLPYVKKKITLPRRFDPARRSLH